MPWNPATKPMLERNAGAVGHLRPRYARGFDAVESRHEDHVGP